MGRIAGALLLMSSLVLGLAACSESAEPEVATPAKKNGGQFAGDRVWPGLAEGKCGSNLEVIAVSGEKEAFSPPETFFKRFQSTALDQGEFERQGVDLELLLSSYQAQQINFQSCDGGSLTLDVGKLSGRPGYLVMTGKGLLKLVGKQDDQYISAIKKINVIRFDTPAVASQGVQP